jgi:small subunit ribosomal protein S1
MVKVIDIDLERRRISLSLKQANEDYHAEFDPSKYGMADSYDEQGNYIFPEGFDSETQEWLEGFDKQREEWEGRYTEAERRHKMHTLQMEKTAADEAAEAAAGGAGGGSSYSSDSGAAATGQAAPESTGGSLASDAQLAALREKLSGNA